MDLIQSASPAAFLPIIRLRRALRAIARAPRPGGRRTD